MLLLGHLAGTELPIDRVLAGRLGADSYLSRTGVRLGYPLLARVASGEVCVSPGFEQRLFGCLVALELVASGQAVNMRTLLEQLE